MSDPSKLGMAAMPDPGVKHDCQTQGSWDARPKNLRSDVFARPK